ncbi:MAG: glycosyltransferase family 9 protein [Planctomycetes bacterium]|nr:glycosyltransferase family 9 protein [Planctomycetota bacterium]
MITAFGRQYHFQKRRWAVIVGLVDAIGTFIFSYTGRNREPGKVGKVLVSRIDHLGDVLLATCALPPLKKAYPEAKIDFLAGEWSKDLLSNNPHVDEIIVYNCILHNRSGSLWQRVTSHAASFLRTLKKIREERYDLAIDLRSYFGNSVPLLYLSGVRYNVGYGTGGFGFLLDKEVPYRTGVHEVLHIADLLKSVGVDVVDEEVRPIYEVSEHAAQQAERLLHSKGMGPKEPFIAIHPGTADKKKEWNTLGWQTVIARLKERHAKVVFCGGPDDTHTIKSILYSVTGDGVIDIYGPLPVEVLGAVFKRASLVIGLDSFPAHLAAAVCTPTVVLWSGINDPTQWRPYGTNVRIVKRDVPCAPCYRSKGCEHMTCMDISPDDVLEMVHLQLGHETD